MLLLSLSDRERKKGTLKRRRERRPYNCFFLFILSHEKKRPSLSFFSLLPQHPQEREKERQKEEKKKKRDQEEDVEIEEDDVSPVSLLRKRLVCLFACMPTREEE